MQFMLCDDDDDDDDADNDDDKDDSDDHDIISLTSRDNCTSSFESNIVANYLS